MQKEVWKKIPNYEGYEVSNLGRVKSLKRNKEKLLKCVTTKHGYNLVCLQINGKQTSINVHKLVALTFLNHIPCGHKLVVDHINNDKTDNRLENLQVITQRENAYRTQGKYTSQYKGVAWHKATNKWQSRIYINNKEKYLGLFDSEYEAHLAYQEALNNINKKEGR